MNDLKYQTSRTADMNLLHARCREDFLLLMKDLTDSFHQGLVKRWLRPFETYRHPQRQREALQNRTSRVGPYFSPHQFGLAVDFVVWENGRWLWPDKDPCWDFLRARATARGLRNELDWDRVHVEARFWEDWHACLKSM